MSLVEIEHQIYAADLLSCPFNHVQFEARFCATLRELAALLPLERCCASRLLEGSPLTIADLSFEFDAESVSGSVLLGSSAAERDHAPSHHRARLDFIYPLATQWLTVRCRSADAEA